MRKVAGLVLFIACTALFLGACSKSMSYADYVKRENNRIEDFRNERNIVVLRDYPSNGVFKSNEYYLDASGVYINVVDSGNGTRAQYRSKVYYRFSGLSSLPIADSDTTNLSDIYPDLLTFTYGITTTYTSSNTSDPGYYYLSTGITVPLQYVGEGAVVKLIIPFKNNIGSAFQNSYYMTYYYDRVTYSTIIN